MEWIPYVKDFGMAAKQALFTGGVMGGALAYNKIARSKKRRNIGGWQDQLFHQDAGKAKLSVPEKSEANVVTPKNLGKEYCWCPPRRYYRPRRGFGSGRIGAFRRYRRRGIRYNRGRDLKALRTIERNRRKVVKKLKGKKKISKRRRTYDYIRYKNVSKRRRYT